MNYTKYKQVLDFPVEKLQLAEEVSEEQKKTEIEQHRQKMLYSIVEINFKNGGVGFI